MLRVMMSHVHMKGRYYAQAANAKPPPPWLKGLVDIASAEDTVPPRAAPEGMTPPSPRSLILACRSKGQAVFSALDGLDSDACSEGKRTRTSRSRASFGARRTKG